MSIKIKIQDDKCIGCGTCESLCPEVFEVKNNVSQVKKVNNLEEKLDCIKEAEESCPVQAIEIENSSK